MASMMRPTIARQACLLQRQSLTSAAKPAFIKTALPKVARVTAFHSTAKRDILPPLPQKLNGTANEAAPVPTPHPTHGSYHWQVERLVSLALVPVTIAPFAAGSSHPTLDATLCALLLVHSHMGFQCCITDYLPKERVPKSRFIADYGLLAGGALAAYGLYKLETEDVGLCGTLEKMWHA